MHVEGADTKVQSVHHEKDGSLTVPVGDCDSGERLFLRDIVGAETERSLRSGITNTRHIQPDSRHALSVCQYHGVVNGELGDGMREVGFVLRVAQEVFVKFLQARETSEERFSLHRLRLHVGERGCARVCASAHPLAHMQTRSYKQFTTTRMHARTRSSC